MRPGRPNRAASSFASSILREPFLGEEALLPVPEDFALWIASPRAATDWLLHAATLEGRALGLDRGVNPPGLTVTGGINYTHDSKRFSTDTASNDTFAGIDLNAAAYAPFRQALLFQGAVARGVPPATAAAFAAANANNPAANPLNPLRQLQFFPPFMNVPNAVEDGKVSDGDFSYTARIAYDLTPSVNVYASFATGYKAASVNLSRDSRPTTADLATLRAQGLAVTNLTSGSRFADPEDSTVYEAGLKGDWGLVTANLAVFKQVIRNFQSNIFTGSGFFLANAGKQSVFGIEFDGSARPVEPLLLTLSMTYLDGKYDSSARHDAYTDEVHRLVERELRALYPERREQLRTELYVEYSRRLPALPLIFAAERFLVDPALRNWQTDPEVAFGTGMEKWWFAEN